MALTLAASGTQTATIGTEHTLDTQTVNGIYELEVDANAMVNGDEVELRCYYTVLSGGTERLLFYRCLQHGQTEAIQFSPVIPSDISCRFTLKQTVGTGRAFPWKNVKCGTVTLVGSGTQTTVIGTEHTLDTEVTSGIFVPVFDVSAFVGGATPDEGEINVYETLLSAGTERKAWSIGLKDNMSEDAKMIPPVVSDISTRLTLKQTAGSARAVPWKLLAVA